MSTRILIADDHALVRRGTRGILEENPEFEVVGEASDGAEAVALAEELQPDLVMMDIGMPVMNGVEATREIKRRWPDISILVLTVHDDDEYVLEAIRAGASGYLLKDVGDQELVRAIGTIREGGAVLDSSVTTVVVGRVRDGIGRSRASAEDLTARELEVLRHLAKGKSNRAIATALNVSPRTVEVHVRHIFEKLGASSRTEAVVVAVRRGILTLEHEG